MRKLLLILGIAALLGAGLYFSVKKVQHKLDAVLTEHESAPDATGTPLKLTGNGSLTGATTLFVPYWSFDKTSEMPDTYSRVVYFGISPGADGINRSGPGYLNLPVFLHITRNLSAKKYLALRMTDSKENFKVLEDKNLQAKLIAQTLTAAKEDGFSGVVVDLELQALPFDKLLGQINDFVSSFSSEARKSQLAFAETFYGDTFYRVRPFDIKTLTRSGDEVMIMAYDFHKAKGNPGPNFPLSGSATYGYDMQHMIQDFLQIVPSNKITVIFGMFGYDWPVDGKGVSQANAQPMSDHEIDQKLINNCDFSKCQWVNDAVSGETKVTYEDHGQQHVVWFEDTESAAKKEQALKKYHIQSYGYWAYSYF